MEIRQTSPSLETMGICKSSDVINFKPKSKHKPGFLMEFSTLNIMDSILIATHWNELNLAHKLGARCLLIENDPVKYDLSILAERQVVILLDKQLRERTLQMIKHARLAGAATVKIFEINENEGGI